MRTSMRVGQNEFENENEYESKVRTSLRMRTSIRVRANSHTRFHTRFRSSSFGQVQTLKIIILQDPATRTILGKGDFRK